MPKPRFSWSPVANTPLRGHEGGDHAHLVVGNGRRADAEDHSWSKRRALPFISVRRSN